MAYRGRWHDGYQGGKGRGNNFRENICTYYGNNGHTMDICYRNHGYQPNWGSLRGNQWNAYANNVGVEDGGNMYMKMLEKNWIVPYSLGIYDHKVFKEQ